MKVREQEPEGFEELWQLWLPYSRNSDGRGKARPTYRKWLLSGADPADILDGARYHIRSLSEKDKPYIQLLATYLNDERWKDECIKERAFQARLAEAEQRRPTPPLKPQVAPEPVDNRTREERVAFMRSVYEKQGLRPPENLH